MAESSSSPSPSPSPSQGAPITRQNTNTFAQLSRRSTSSANVNVKPQWRQSSSDRINDILENARERADSMAIGTPASKSPRAPSSPVLGRPPSTVMLEDEAAHERMGIVSQGSDVNYQSFQMRSDSGARPRRSVLNDRRSQPSLRSQGQLEAMEYPSETSVRQDEGDEKSWWKTHLGRFQSIELENKGSVARDHLAIERTFLAWLRTSLSFASIGIAVTQLFRLNTSIANNDGSNNSNNMDTLRSMGKPIGTTFLGISILTLFLGYKRYFQSQEWVIKGKFPASRGTVTIVAFLAFGIMVASLAVVAGMEPGNRRS